MLPQRRYMSVCCLYGDLLIISKLIHDRFSVNFKISWPLDAERRNLKSLQQELRVSAAGLNPQRMQKSSLSARKTEFALITAHKSKGLDILCHPWEWPLSFLRPTYENVKQVVDHLANRLDNIVCRRIWH